MTFMPFLAFHFHFTLVSSYFSLSLIPFQMKFKGSVHSHFNLQERNALTKTQAVHSVRLDGHSPCHPHGKAFEELQA